MFKNVLLLFTKLHGNFCTHFNSYNLSNKALWVQLAYPCNPDVKVVPLKQFMLCFAVEQLFIFTLLIIHAMEKKGLGVRISCRLRMGVTGIFM